MKIIVITIGKKHDPYLRDAIRRYEKRLEAFCDLTWRFIPNSSVDTESINIERLLRPEDLVILLDETGEQASNTDLASFIETAQNNSIKKIVIIIGGAYGVNHMLIARSNRVLSLSTLVFPHQIVRLLVVEQLYRAYTILSGGKYHHD